MADISDPFDQSATSAGQDIDPAASPSPACPSSLTQPSSYVSPPVAAGVVSADEMAAILAELNKPEHRGKGFIPMPPHLQDAINRLYLWEHEPESKLLH